MPWLLLLLLLSCSPHIARTETQQESTGPAGAAQHRPTAGAHPPHSFDQAQGSAAVPGPSTHPQHPPQRQLQQQYQHHGQQLQKRHRQQGQDPRGQWQQQQQQRRQLLGPQEPAAPAGPFANLTVGNVTAGREHALRKALLDGYDDGAFPWAEYGPAQVKINLALHKILEVNLAGGTLKLAVWLRLEWSDPRLTWDAKEWNVSKAWFKNPQQGDTEIWQPDITLWNAGTPILYTLSQNPFIVRSDGRVNWGRLGVFEAACNFKGLSAYPFGQVRCELELGSWSYGPWYVNVTMQGKGYDVGGSVTSGESAVWTEYKIQNVTARRHTYPPYPCCPDESDWPVVLINLALERQNLIYMLKVVVPQIILTAIAFSTFWLSPACGERLGLAVTVPLAVAVYDLLTFSTLPVSNKVTLVSAMGMTAFLFSMAVLLENALVIQLWHYSEHTYFKGLSVLAATAVAYRQQLVWVHLLSCIHQLKTEVARRQLAVLQSNRSITPRSRSLSRSPSLKRWQDLLALQEANRSPTPDQTNLAPAGSGSYPANTTGKDVAAAVGAFLDASEGKRDGQITSAGGGQVPDAGSAGGNGKGLVAMGGVDDTKLVGQQGALDKPAGRSVGWQVLGRAVDGMTSPVGARAGADEAQVPVPATSPEPMDASSNAHLLLCTSKEQLRVHLRNILASTDPSLSAMQRRIQKAYLVFGEEGVCSRLHGVLAGQGAAPVAGEAALTQPAAGSGTSDADDAASAKGADAGSVSLDSRFNVEFNRRWQLLSAIIDHVCRYLFIVAYLVSMVAIIVALTSSDA